MICDAHIHYIPKSLSGYTSFYKGVWSDKDNLFSYLDQNRVEKALLVYPCTDAHLKIGQDRVCQIYNQAQQDIIKSNSRVIGAGLLNLDKPGNLPEQVAFLKEKGFGALNLSSSFQGKFLGKELKPFFKAAEKYSLPIFVHPQTINPIGFERVKDPLLMPVLEYSFDLSMFMGLILVEGILRDFNVKFIFSSLGGVVPFLKDRFDRVYQMLRAREMVKDLGALPSLILKKVYVDTSGAGLENIKLASNLFGEDKILWGSDYPVNPSVEDNLSNLDELGSFKEKIISQNFKKLFNL